VPDSYEKWLNDVRAALDSIKMGFGVWDFVSAIPYLSVVSLSSEPEN
jgi:hypothetical protein